MALKLIKLISKEMLIEGIDNEKLLDEIIILNNLERPNLVKIVKIYDFFDDGKNYYIAKGFYEEGVLLENVTKIDLSRIIKRKNCFYLNENKSTYKSYPFSDIAKSHKFIKFIKFQYEKSLKSN